MAEIHTVNGVKVIFVPTNSNIVNARILVNAGSADEDEDSYGVAHFLEHMVFKGTEHRNYKEVNKITSLLGTINAYTSNYTTCFHYSFLSDDIKKALEILFEIVFKSSLPEQEIEKEKGVIIEECQMYLDNPNGYFFNIWRENIFGQHNGHPIVGYPQSIQETTLEKLVRFKTKNYNKQNIAIGVCGSIDLPYLMDLLSNLIPNDLPDGELKERENLEINYDNFSFNHESKQAIMALSAKGYTSSETSQNNYLQSVYFEGLCGEMHSLLFEKIREDLGLCYSISGGTSSHKHYGLSSIYSMLDEKNINLAHQEILKTIDKTCSEGFPEDILEITKRNVLFNTARLMETNAGLLRKMDILFELNDTRDLLPKFNFEYYRNAINSITNNDIMRYANEIFGENQQIKLTTMTQKKSDSAIA